MKTTSSSSKMKQPRNGRVELPQFAPDTLKSINQLRAPLWEAIVAELEGSGLKHSFLARATSIGKHMQTAFGQFRAGKVSRAEAIDSYQAELLDFQRDYEDKTVDALWKHAKLQPSTPEVLSRLHGKSARDHHLMVSTDKYLGWYLKYDPETAADAETLQLGLGGVPAPPPFGLCDMPPFSFHDDRTSSQAISVDNLAMSSLGSGSVFVAVMGDFAGGATAHSLVGTDVDIPAGFTNISVTATVSWTFSGWSFAIGGVAGTGADLWLWIENPAGQIAAQGNSPLFALLSPVAWGNSASGSGDSVMQASLATPDASARTIRIFAGASAHAEAFATFSAGCDAIVTGRVTKICVMAT